MPAAASEVGFLDPNTYDFVHHLERNAPVIRNELDELLREDLFQKWPEAGIYDGVWDVFGFSFFGKQFAENCARCPVTVNLLKTVPGLTTAGYSRLRPQTHIRPHFGYTKAVLRCHLGLVVPSHCGLRVGAEVKCWTEGRCLVFDDTLEHEAWNRSDQDRIVLLIDFIRGEGTNNRC